MKKNRLPRKLLEYMSEGYQKHGKPSHRRSMDPEQANSIIRVVDDDDDYDDVVKIADLHSIIIA